MREVLEQFDLALLQKEGRGLNARNDVKGLHRAGCEAVGAMVSSAYPKIFFEQLDEALKWLDAEYGKSGFCHVGFATPTRRPSTPKTSDFSTPASYAHRFLK